VCMDIETTHSKLAAFGQLHVRFKS